MSEPTSNERPREERWSLAGAVASQRRFVYLAVVLLCVAGIWAALRGCPSAIYPELQFSRIAIVAEGSSLGARQVVFAITQPLEEAVGVVPGVTRVQSRSIRGASEISVTFSPSTDMAYALQQTQARVNQVRGDLPPGLDIQVERLSPSLFPIPLVQSRGRRSGDAVRHRAIPDSAGAVARAGRGARRRAGVRHSRDRGHRRSGAAVGAGSVVRRRRRTRSGCRRR